AQRLGYPSERVYGESRYGLAKSFPLHRRGQFQNTASVAECGCGRKCDADRGSCRNGLSYRLYAGHTGDTSILVRDWQASGTFASLPSTTKTYWIRATNTCQADGTTVSGDSAEATVLPRPVVTATATSSS